MLFKFQISGENLAITVSHNVQPIFFGYNVKPIGHVPHNTNPLKCIVGRHVVEIYYQFNLLAAIRLCHMADTGRTPHSKVSHVPLAFKSFHLLWSSQLLAILIKDHRSKLCQGGLM